MKKTILPILMAAVCSVHAAVVPPASTKTERIYLSGRGCDDPAMWSFTVSDGMGAGRKGTIAVPSCWEQQGYGAYTYGRWYTVKGAKPSTEEGCYTYTFTVPRSWTGKQVEIVFEGVMTDATVLVNGLPAGEMHQGGFTAFSYDITDKVKYGKKNTLEVTVQKESADRSINAAERKADWWLFGGIYRPVYLTAKPAVNIRRSTVDARADGQVRVQLLTTGATGCSVSAEVSPLGSDRFTASATGAVGIDADSCEVSFKFDGVETWDPEHPHLYDLRLCLTDADGATVHETTQRIGFRTVEFRRGDGFYLNGTKLLVKGVNRHCFYPESGRTGSARLDLEDVKLIKGMNANAIRSHYPPDAHLLDICDSLGVLYLDELAGWQNAYSTAQGERILREMVTHDASHPCIFAWSNGNEGGFNHALDSLFSRYDPQERHVVHAWAMWDGVDAHHYPAYQTGMDRLNHGHEVFMPTEFLHAQYDKGGGASLADFWSNWRQSPLFAGGFIWAWADEGVARTDRGGAIDTDGPNAPDGLVGPYREKEGSWYTVREVWSPVRFAPFTYNADWDGTLTVTNEFLFSDLGECSLVSEHLTYGGEVVGRTETPLPSALPGEARRMKIPLDHAADMLRLTVLGARGDTLNVLGFERKPAPCPYTLAQAGKTSAKISCHFNDSTGMLEKVTVGGREIPFGNGPVPVGMKAQFKSGYYTRDGADSLYVAKYSGAVDSIVWRMTPDGLLGMEAVLLNDRRGHGYEGAFIEDGARCFGFSFDYPEQLCTGMTWLGQGPYRVWRNRREGQPFGLWHKDYNNTVTGELPDSTDSRRLDYPEFKGYHGDVRMARIESESAPFTVYSGTDGMYLRMFTPAEPRHRRDGKNTMTAFPPGDISFLVDIPPIQSYKPLEQLGPSAMAPTVRINPGDEGVRIKLVFAFE